MKTLSIPALCEAVRLAIYNTSENQERQQKMSGYGFTPKRIKEGKSLLEQVRLMDDTQQQHYLRVREVSQQIEQDRTMVLDVFRGHVAIAKTAFRKDPLLVEGLRIKRISTKQWGRIQQAIDFYRQAPQYMDTLQQFGATPEAFQQNEAAAEALLALRAQRLQNKGEAENSTQRKKETTADLRAWYGEFRRLARLAFQDTPQILESYGMVVRSSPRKRKVAAE